jgi:hypothetical protein
MRRYVNLQPSLPTSEKEVGPQTSQIAVRREQFAVQNASASARPPTTARIRMLLRTAFVEEKFVSR